VVFVGVEVGVIVAVLVAVGVFVAVLLAVGVFVAVRVGVAVAVGVAVLVAVWVGVLVGVRVAVLVAVGVAVGVRVAVGVELGLMEPIRNTAPKLVGEPIDAAPNSLPEISPTSSPTGFQPSVESLKLYNSVSVQSVCPAAGGLSL